MRKKVLRNSIPYLGMLAGIAILDLCAYGGILHSRWVILCLVGALSVICLLRGRGAEYPARTARKANIAIWIFCAAVFLLDVILSGSRYHLIRYYFYGAVFYYLILCILEKKDILPEKRLRFLYWLGLGELAGITAVFCLASGFSTRQQAEAVLEKNGFTGVEWVQTCETEMVSSVFFQTAHAAEPDMTAKERQVDFYLFYGEKDQKGYCLVFIPAENELFRMVEVGGREEIQEIFGEPHWELI